MRSPTTALFRPWRAHSCSRRLLSTSSPPVIKIENGTFYRDYPSPGWAEQENNLPFFSGLNFTLPSVAESSSRLQHWAVVGSSGKAQFLHVLRGSYICLPPTARTYPYLATSKNPRLRFPAQAIRYVGFNHDTKQAGSGAIRGAYLSARYESRREETDFTVLQYLKGQTSLNPLDTDGPGFGEALLNRVIADLRLEKLVDMPVANLSNGQGRRARIAKALLHEPEVLLLDEPFMGLDPPTVKSLSPLLHNLATQSAPRLILSLRPQERVPEWITHLVVLGPGRTVALQGESAVVLKTLEIWRAVASRRRKDDERLRLVPPSATEEEFYKSLPVTERSAVLTQLGWWKSVASRRENDYRHLLPRSAAEEDFYQSLSAAESTEYHAAEQARQEGQFERNLSILYDFGLASPSQPSSSSSTPATAGAGEAIVEMDGVQVKYGEKTVLGGWKQTDTSRSNREGLFWKVQRGQRWGVFGLNGSGKTTLISLITSDHPQTYAQPVKLFGRSRLPEPGKPALSIFDLQARIGHSSPEIHAFFPRRLSIRATIESAWADTFLAKPQLTWERNLDVDAALKFFAADLKPDFVPADHDYGRSLGWARSLRFSSLSLPAQKLLLFLRAVIHKPDLVVLDEAFAGMPSTLRDKCLHFLEVGETRNASTGTRRTGQFEKVWHLPPNNFPSSVRHTGLSEEQALIVISHVKEEVPDVVSHWMRLPSAQDEGDGSGGPLRLRMGVLGKDQTVAGNAWDDIWND